jgi:hypothetical protein
VIDGVVVVEGVVVALDGGASVEEPLEPTSPESASVTDASGSAAPALPVPALPITASESKAASARISASLLFMRLI